MENLFNEEYIIELNSILKKYQKQNSILIQWMKLKNKNIQIGQYFVSHNYKHVGIYGMAELGLLLEEELKNCRGIESLIAIDKRYNNIDCSIPVFSPEDNIPKVDILINTVAVDYIDVSKKMKEKGIDNIVLLEDIVYELF